VIVVVGSPCARQADDVPVPAGLPASIALAAAGAGAAVQLVGKLGDDDAGDAVLLALTQAGVGHAATLRDAANPTPLAEVEPPEAIGGLSSPLTEVPVADRAGPSGLHLDPGDIDLALRYLTDFGVVVVADELSEAALHVVADAAGYAGAAFVLLSTTEPPAWLPAAATVLAPPPESDGPFSTVVGEYAAALDRGVPAGEAFRDLVDRLGWQPATVD
jgi:sugar/nucleoside kinase (ribokinase family)